MKKKDFMKKLLYFMKDYKKESVLAPLFKMLEAFFELFVPLVVASIIDDGIVLVIQLSQPATDISLLFFDVPLVRIYPYSSRKFYLLVPDACYKINVRRLFGLGFSKVEFASDLVDEKLCIHKAVL